MTYEQVVENLKQAKVAFYQIKQRVQNLLYVQVHLGFTKEGAKHFFRPSFETIAQSYVLDANIMICDVIDMIGRALNDFSEVDTTDITNKLFYTVEEYEQMLDALITDTNNAISLLSEGNFASFAGLGAARAYANISTKRLAEYSKRAKIKQHDFLEEPPVPNTEEKDVETKPAKPTKNKPKDGKRDNKPEPESKDTDTGTNPDGESDPDRVHA